MDSSQNDNDEQDNYVFYEPKPDEKFQFMNFDYQVIYRQHIHIKESGMPFFKNKEEIKHWRPYRLKFHVEKYCYKPMDLLDLEDQVNLKKNYEYGFGFLSHTFPFVFIKSLLTTPFAEACSIVEPYDWIRPEYKSFVPDENQKYFFLWKFYNEANEVIFEKNQHITNSSGRTLQSHDSNRAPDHYSKISLPYFTQARSVKVFLIENSTGKEIKEIGKISIETIEKIKEFPDKRIMNCHVK